MVIQSKLKGIATRILGPIPTMIGKGDGKKLFGISCIAGSLMEGSFQLLCLLILWNKSSIDAIDYSFYQYSSASAGFMYRINAIQMIHNVVIII